MAWGQRYQDVLSAIGGAIDDGAAAAFGQPRQNTLHIGDDGSVTVGFGVEVERHYASAPTQEQWYSGRERWPLYRQRAR
nr:hypothetical protein [Rhodococcus sp. 15-1154-1]